MSWVWDIPVPESTRVRDVHRAAEAACGRIGLDTQTTAAAALVATELATNLVKHANGGRIIINLVGRSDPAADRTPCVQITSLDHGPGIPDVAKVLKDGYTTAPSSLGAGLGTCLRLSTDFDLHSRPGRGTVAVARVCPAPPRARTRPAAADVRAGGINTSLAQAEHSGDAFAWVRSGSLVTMLLADGLGHGSKAAEASTAALEGLHRTAHLRPTDILRFLHGALRPTRGAAIGVAQLDESESRLSYAGVGNIGARLHGDEGWQALISHPGIVGAHFPANVPLHQSTWRPRSLLVLHSDGLPSRWVPPEDPRIPAHDPAVVAAMILRDAGSAARPQRDDTSVAVLAPNHRTDVHDRNP
ncbi:ATP-binding protein [Streptomyces sp. NPDC003635]